MRRQSTYNQNSNIKIILYALGFVLFAGIAVSHGSISLKRSITIKIVI